MKRRNLILIISSLTFLSLAIFATVQIVLSMKEYSASDKEYEELRLMYEPPDYFPPVTTPIAEVVVDMPDKAPYYSASDTTPIAEIVCDIPVEIPIEEQEETEQPAAEHPTLQQAVPQPVRNPAEVNHDYICWLKIRTAEISYPVVQTVDNSKYLDVSFEGWNNRLGAIFMDYRCMADFSGYHTIIYGHNARNGSMFGSLSKYLDSGYLDRHSEITITLPDGSVETWRIFSAYQTTTDGLAYRLDFSGPEAFATFAKGLGAPEEVSRILTLSTCAAGGGSGRVLLHAVPPV